MLKKLMTVSLVGILLFGLNVLAQSESKDDGTKKIRDIGLDIAIVQSWARYSNDKQCGWLASCQAVCADIYHSPVGKENCEALPISQVNKLRNISNIFDSPSSEELMKVNFHNQGLFVAIDSGQALNRLFGKLSSSEAKEVLIWIARDWNAADHFAGTEIKNQLLRNLILTSVGGGGDTNFMEAFGKPIVADRSFMELALINGNDIAFNWTHDFFEAACPKHFSNHVAVNPVCVLKNLYCQEGLTEDNWSDLLDYRNFEAVVDDIIVSFTTESPPAWWADEDMYAMDLEVAQLEALCTMDLVRKEKREEGFLKILTQSWARYPGDIACEERASCKKICEDIYWRSTFSQDYCGRFPRTQVRKLGAIDEHLPAFVRESLTIINPLDLEVFTDIDSQVLAKHINSFSSSGKRKFLAWMAKDSKVLNIFEEADENDNLWRILLEDIKDEETGIGEAFTKEIYDGKSFIDLAVVWKIDGKIDGNIVGMNIDALKWMEDVFNEHCYDREGFDSSYEERTLCEFKEGYCQLGLTEAYWKVLLTPQGGWSAGISYHTVKNILNKFITNTPPEWWVEGVDPINLGATEMNALCEMDLVKKEE